MGLHVCGSVEASFNDAAAESALFSTPPGIPRFYRAEVARRLLTQQFPSKDILLRLYAEQNGVKGQVVSDSTGTSGDANLWTVQLSEFWADDESDVTAELVEDPGVTATYEFKLKVTPL